MPLMAPENWPDPHFKPLILIVAQSGRFLAQMATRAGYSVRVADQFADNDTLAITDHHRLLADFDKLNERQVLQIICELADNKPAILIIGTGLERFFACLAKLPTTIQSANNALPALLNCLTPKNWFALLADLAIPYPSSQFSLPTESNNWLQKQARHWGGSHIQHTPIGAHAGAYYQQKINGQPASVLFIAAGDEIRLISFNRQYCRAPALGNYQLLAIANNLTVTKAQSHWLKQTCQKLSHTLGLRGFQSLDFIIDAQGQCWVLELNPRPSASLQCLPTDWPLLDWHIQACQGQLPAIDELPAAPACVWYCCYANQDMTIPSQFNWPEFASDLPTENTVIMQNQIICTLLFECPTKDILQHGHALEKQLQLQLLDPLEKPSASAI